MVIPLFLVILKKSGPLGGSSSIVVREYDTTKLADYLDNYPGKNLSSCPLHTRTKGTPSDILSKILHHVKSLRV